VSFLARGRGEFFLSCRFISSPLPGAGEQTDRHEFKFNKRKNLKPLAQTNNIINPIPHPFVKRNQLTPNGEHLQVNLRTSKPSERRFSMQHQPSPEPAPSKRTADGKRINPPSMPVITTHDSAGNDPVHHTDEEQLRLSRQLVGDRQSRIALRPRRIRILGKHIAPQSDHGIAIARFESPNDHSVSSTERSIASI